jgi:diadenosine tetraphosphate (Ap4A) HIT family hydrolase
MPRGSTSSTPMNTRRSARTVPAQNAVRVAGADHMNVESLGNVVPHLHWHIVPRYLDDARWGMPVWTTPLSAMPDTRLDDTDRAQLIEAIRAALREAFIEEGLI